MSRLKSRSSQFSALTSANLSPPPRPPLLARRPGTGAVAHAWGQGRAAGSVGGGTGRARDVAGRPGRRGAWTSP